MPLAGCLSAESMPKKPKITFASEPRTNGLKRAIGVTFGRVTVTSTKPEADVVAQNIAAGQSALKRAAEKISRPGIALRPAKGVPLYYIDDTRPKEIARELDGQKVYGAFRNGKFVASNR
jgi:hypothetical protein